jgi:superfamily II DNA or RNA helicase
MILRGYQERVIAKADAALKKHGNTLVVSPTGSGKTIMLSALARKVDPKKALILQHRSELVQQNMSKYLKINPNSWPSLYTAGQKSWGGNAIFAMVQTLARHTNTIPPLDLLIIDEAHHTAANSYRKIVDAVRKENPECKIAGFTATPERQDKKGLLSVFSNVADQITLKELIDQGFLVPPRSYVVDVGTQNELSKVRRLASDYDMDEVEKIMNKRIINQEVVRNWKEKAGDRRTIVFCSTIAHAEDVMAAFKEASVSVGMVTGETPDGERKALIKQLKNGALQVLCNVAVFTEGFDEPLVSSIVLLRPCSHKSTLIQMIGRGLRPVNCKDHPGVIKRDCVVLDFGTSLLTHGDLNTTITLGNADKPGESEPGECPQKQCPTNESTEYKYPDRKGQPGCGAMIPCGCKECPLCGFIFEREGTEYDILEEVNLTEIDILNGSPFRWVDLFGSGRLMIASGFGSFSVVANPNGSGDWFAIGKEKDSRVLKMIGVTGKVQAFAMADDFLRQNETSDAAMKGATWMRHRLSDGQAEKLYQLGYQEEDVKDLTKLTATAHLNFQWNRKQIERLLGV